MMQLLINCEITVLLSCNSIPELTDILEIVTSSFLLILLAGSSKSVKNLCTANCIQFESFPETKKQK